MQLDSDPATINLGHTKIYIDMVDRDIQHIVCYVDRGPHKQEDISKVLWVWLTRTHTLEMSSIDKLLPRP
jgi:hypothetical protein